MLEVQRWHICVVPPIIHNRKGTLKTSDKQTDRHTQIEILGEDCTAGIRINRSIKNNTLKSHFVCILTAITASITARTLKGSLSDRGCQGSKSLPLLYK